MASLSLKEIQKVYSNGVEAVKNVSLEIEGDEFIIFVGPSGCGKTTLLRMIAGLEEITSGELLIDDKNMNKVDPKDRDIAMVFQNYALYPHMTVYKNITLGLKLRRVPKAEIQQRVTDAANMLKISHLLDRRPKLLSGGERQRVAMARAIVREPKLFLMDEPLSNLDAKLRVQMRSEIARLHRQLKTTFIFVTHDQTEAMTLGTRIVVMRNGEIQQVDTPHQIYHHPANMFVASFIGSPEMNFIETTPVYNDSGVCLAIGGQCFMLEDKWSLPLIEAGYLDRKVMMGIRPSDIQLNQGTAEAKKEHTLQVPVDYVENLGDETNIHFTIAGTRCIGKVTIASSFHIGQVLDVSLDFSKIHLFDMDSEKSLEYLTYPQEAT